MMFSVKLRRVQALLRNGEALILMRHDLSGNQSQGLTFMLRHDEGVRQIKEAMENDSK